MTVIASGRGTGRLCRVVGEATHADGAYATDFSCIFGEITSDLRLGVSPRACERLVANEHIASTGLIPGSRGFVLSKNAALTMLKDEPSAKQFLVPFLNGRDITQKTRSVYLIDTYGRHEAELATLAPRLYQHLRDTVWPSRKVNRDPRLRANWWLPRRSNEQVRSAISSLTRYLVTVETAKHRVFLFVPAATRPEHKLVVVASDDAHVLSCLSSRLHVAWALAAGGFLGVGNDPVYAKTLCFDPFPFPEVTDIQIERTRELGERLDAHRKRQQALHPSLTLTGMYNVLAKLRSDEPLTEEDKVIHAHGLVSVLKQIHDDLDAAVFAAYGWPPDLTDEQIVEHLVALNNERAKEERRGIIRWLRPAYQIPRSGPLQGALIGDKPTRPTKVTKKKARLQRWPKNLPDRVAAVRGLIATGPRPWSASDVASAFAKPADNLKRPMLLQVEEVLDALAALGLVVAWQSPSGRRWQPPASGD